MRSTISRIGIFVVLFATLFLTPAWAETASDVTIVYGGNIHGKLTPTMICGGSHAGGFARKAFALDELREKKKNVIFVDNGGLFAVPARKDQELRARQSFALYDFMQLDALNLGQREFYFGLTYLAKAAEKVSFPLVSSNIESSTPLPWMKKFVVVESGGYKVGIVGVLPEKSFDTYVPAEGVKGLTITPPKDALAKVVPEVRRQADMVLLLSQLDDDATTALVKEIPGIDLAVSSSDKRLCELPPEKGKLVLPSGVKGQDFLTVSVTKENDKLVISQNEPQLLDQPDKIHPLVSQMIEDSTKDYMEVLRAQQREKKANVKVFHSVEEFNRMIEEQKERLQAESGQGQGEEIGAKLKYNGQEIPAKIRLHRKPKPGAEGEDGSAQETDGAAMETAPQQGTEGETK